MATSTGDLFGKSQSRAEGEGDPTRTAPYRQAKPGEDRLVGDVDGRLVR